MGFSFQKIIKLMMVCILFSLIGGSVWAEKKQSKTPIVNTDSNRIEFNFRDVPIHEFIKHISKFTKKNFIIDDRVRGKVTILSPKKFSVDEAYKVFLSVLEVHGYAAVESGELTKIVSSPEARSKSLETRIRSEVGPTDDKIVTQIIPLKYAEPKDIKRLFTPLISKSSVILDYSPANMLIVTDVSSNIQRLMKILEYIDVSGIGQELSLIPLKHASASKMSKLLNSIFQSRRRRIKKSDADEGIKIVDDERTNTLIILASEDYTSRIRELLKMLDKETPPGKEKIHVYYLENATAEELAKVLVSVPAKKNVKGIKSPVATAPLISGNMTVTADKATNSLIIMAEKEEYLVLEEIIKKLDIPRAMVYIECLIMEVNVDRDISLGSELVMMGEGSYDGTGGAYGGGFSGGDPGYSGLTGMVTPNIAGAGTLPPGFSMGVFSTPIEIGNVMFSNLGAMIKAYKKDRDVKILSTPQILTTDNQEAKITVGKNVPYKTKSGSSTVESYNTYEYKDVGISLKITPHISKDRLVRLQISQEVNKVDEFATSNTDDRPTTLKRTVDTTVIVRDKDTVVIGGLIDDSFSRTEYKVPCLGDIPFLRWLFKNLSRANEKTNLFIFLSPHVVETHKEADKIVKEKKDYLDKIQEGNIKFYPEDEESAQTSGDESESNQ